MGRPAFRKIFRCCWGPGWSAAAAALAFAAASCGDDSDSTPEPTPTPDASSEQDAAPDDDAEAGISDVTDASESEAAVPTKATFQVDQSLDIATVATGHLAFPDMTRLPDGRILLVYRQGAKHVDNSGRIMKQYGTSDALTWTAPEVLYDEEGIDDRDPSVATLANGDVWVNYFQYKTYALTDGTMSAHHIFAARSTDQGKTFGAFVQVNPGSMAPSNPKLNAEGRWVDDTDTELFVQASSSALLELGGELVVPSYGGYPLNLKDLAHCPKSWITLYKSVDGQSWAEEPVAFGATTTWLQEPALLRLASGRVLMHVRTATGSTPSNPGKMKQAVSTDEGATWSALEDFPFVGHAPELAQMKSGLLLTAYRELNDAYTQEWVSFSWSLDDGDTWSEPVRVQDCGASECGYPAILELEGQRFVLAYYAPGGKAIKAALYQYSLE